MSANQEAQLDELLALASIYDEEEFRKRESMQKGEIRLCLELPPNFRLLVKGQACVECGISFLPPLVLSFELPTDYPSSSAPGFTLSSKWLSRVQVKLLVSQDEFARYDRLLLQWSLNLMADVVYCPRMSCCMAVIIEPDTTMGICPSCQFVFCTLCKRTYHGLSLCKKEDLCMLKDAAEKEKELLKKKSKDNEKQLIQGATDEKLSEDWLKENCKQCPSCGANIQKVQGCNKMTCSSCKQYFCWLCLAVLSRRDPYNHFKDSSSSCYDQILFNLFFWVIFSEADDCGVMCELQLDRRQLSAILGFFGMGMMGEAATSHCLGDLLNI